MNHSQSDGQILAFDLTTSEAAELSSLLSHLLCDTETGRESDILGNVYEKLRDAAYLATWKRENVNLELTTDELMSLNRAIHHVGGSSLTTTFCLTGELRCCLIATPEVDRM